ncbi:MAG: nickel pincer cofactor biosynthesis protein LarB [Firmicutes bacterium]|nr:nickel pincer cofactor biosynthesis protein LarB [Bacillota bacterium]
MNELMQLLRAVEQGRLSAEDAALQLKTEPFADLGYAKVDHHRRLRQGAGEVIYGAGKTAEQILGISRDLYRDTRPVLITRLSAEAAETVGRELPLDYRPLPRLGIVGGCPPPDTERHIAVATGGTSDIPVAEEAAVTAEFLGCRVDRLYDVGVSGLHRLLSRLDVLLRARAVVAVAGMEGALPSVIGGLVDCPVIAVPTSVGYGASFGGAAALLAMLNSCASGVSVVNIDNGFGAGYIAAMIGHIGEYGK